MESNLSGWIATLLSQVNGAEPDMPVPLNPGGWIVMLLSVGAVVAVVLFCVIRVLRLPSVEMEELKGPLEIDTGDTNNAD